jgi:hypothetical protein
MKAERVDITSLRGISTAWSGLNVSTRVIVREQYACMMSSYIDKTNFYKHGTSTGKVLSATVILIVACQNFAMVFGFERLNERMQLATGTIIVYVGSHVRVTSMRVSTVFNS